MIYVKYCRKKADKMKKILSLLLCGAMVMSLSTNVLAAREEELSLMDSSPVIINGVDITVDVEEEMQRAISGITDLPTANTPEVMMLSMEEDNGVDTYTTTRRIDVPNIDGEVYATTTFAIWDSEEKVETGTKNSNYVTAYGTLYWIDHFGPENEFVKASGGWSVDVNPSTGKKATLSNRRIELYGQNSVSDRIPKSFKITGNTFTIDRTMMLDKKQTYSLTTKVTINASITLKLMVQTSILS